MQTPTELDDWMIWGTPHDLGNLHKVLPSGKLT